MINMKMWLPWNWVTENTVRGKTKPHVQKEAQKNDIKVPLQKERKNKPTGILAS